MLKQVQHDGSIFLRGLVIICILFHLVACDNSKESNKTDLIAEKKSPYLNHSDSAKYVGMNTCKLCHQTIYSTFIETGMGKSFDVAGKKKSSGDFEISSVKDLVSNFRYHAFWKNDSLYMKEFRLKNRDTIFQRLEQVNYIIGSGQHTNSHLQNVNGYVNQMPMTFYSQKHKWDLPPGFEGGVNTRFSRKIGLECMTCHNAFPEIVVGSENKYSYVPNGIDCERCHGPGSFHVEKKQAGEKIDTSKYIDYSIVNPAKLSIDAQFDICQRCHLQGNAVLKNNKSFFDFKPGMKLSDFISVFLPKYKNADDEFIMASHADRLKQSPCFIKSMEENSSDNKLKPYKNAMTCLTCHNPHVSVRETNENVFNDACLNCHQNFKDSKVLYSKHSHYVKNMNNCVGCHMPLSGSIDIPHVAVHDHYIRKPLNESEKNKVKEFVGLFSINEKNPDVETRIQAYLNQYEKFEQKPYYLDSASLLLKSISVTKSNFRLAVRYYFIKREYEDILKIVNRLNEAICFDSLLIAKSYENSDAWTAYRIADANYFKGNSGMAVKWFEKSVLLSPYNLEFRNKLGTAYATVKQYAKALKEFEFILKQNPKFVSAYTNLGYLKLLNGNPDEAFNFYKKALSLDPDNEAALTNLIGYYLNGKDLPNAKKYLEQIIKINPKNERAIKALNKLNKIG